MDVELGAAGRIEVLTELQRMRSWVDAQEQVLLGAMVEPGDPPRSLVDERVVEKQFVREEVACALTLSPLTVNDRLHVARELTRRLPATLALLAAGEITMRAARLLVDAVTVLPDAVAAGVEGRVLGRAPGQTVANFRACVQRAVLALDPRPQPQRHDTAVQGCADALPAECYPPGPHAADQRRADALVTLITREQTEVASGAGVASVRRRHGRRPGVQVTVALSTLLGLDDEPGELAGHGPIPAVLARRIAADPSGTWRRLVTDAVGRLLDCGRSVYRPPQDLTGDPLPQPVAGTPDSTPSTLPTRRPRRHPDLDLTDRPRLPRPTRRTPPRHHRVRRSRARRSRARRRRGRVRGVTGRRARSHRLGQVAE